MVEFADVLILGSIIFLVVFLIIAASLVLNDECLESENLCYKTYCEYNIALKMNQCMDKPTDCSDKNVKGYRNFCVKGRTIFGEWKK